MVLENERALQSLSSAMGTSQQQLDLLARFVEQVEAWNQRNNLISNNDVNRIVSKHVADSWNFCQDSLLPPAGSVLDLGSGAGFPGMVIAIMRPDLQLTLLDSRRMRALFLKEASQVLQLTNVQVLCQRAEMLAAEQPGRFNVITARAVAGLAELWVWAAPLLQAEGWLVTQKGVNENLSAPQHTLLTRIPMLHSSSDSVLVKVKAGGSDEQSGV